MEFDDLYREIILDHYRNPRNQGNLDHVPEESVHENPSCGDSVKLEISVGESGKVKSVTFDAQGCAISVASASMMSELLTGKPVQEARAIITEFNSVMRGEAESSILETWGDIASLAGVVSFPLRVKCATLAWHAADDALGSYS
jgi:nitrogen fixation NifU-like protein